jgi:hypothetical protein
MSEYENFNDPLIYKKTEDFNLSTGVLFNNYLNLLATFHSLFNKNIVTKKTNYKEFIYLQGMKCLNHIFILLLQYTNNLSFTRYHCEKGIYYFTEFISQIENENSFLKLSSIDAIIFVYKKTIYNINKSMIKNTKKQSIVDVDNIIKILANINKYENYDKLKHLYIKLLNVKPPLRLFEMKIEECSTLNNYEETLKNVL